MKIKLEWPMYIMSWSGKDETEVMFDVVVEVTPGDPGCHTMKNGDPGWPASGPECEILSIGLSDIGRKAAIDLDPILWPMLGFRRDECAKIEEKALEMASRKAEDDAADRADHEYDLRKDGYYDRD